MKIIAILFPFKLYLTILQLEEYHLSRLASWIIKHPFKRQIIYKKPLVLTSKTKTILLLSLFWLTAISFMALSLGPLFSTLIFFILSSQPYLLYGFALTTMFPAEYLNKLKTIRKTHARILELKKKGLKVVAITGSFGKTSTKEILYQFLSPHFRVYRSPLSFNTIFGLSKAIDFELDQNYKFFLCEMAAYKIGEIKTLTKMIPPDFGILTGITSQHYEKFGSLENTVKAKFELVEAVKDKSKMIFNLNDKNITEQLRLRKIKPKNIPVKISKISFNKSGSKFDIKIKNKSFHCKTQLFGLSNISNIKLACQAALMLGIPSKAIIRQIGKLRPFSNRSFVKRTVNATIVDSTYSSNPRAFEETILTASKISGKKALVTPGLVELGRKEKETHYKLGKMSTNVFDLVVLVGKNSRTKSFRQGFLGKNVEFIEDSRKDYFQKIQQLSKNYDWIFLENDVTQNY